MREFDWQDTLAKKLEMPEDWREIGFDDAETMIEMYERTPGGAMVCPWPRCSFARKDALIEELFVHVHNPKGHGRKESRR